MTETSELNIEGMPEFITSMNFLEMAQLISSLPDLMTEVMGLYSEVFGRLSTYGWYVSPQILDQIPDSEIGVYLREGNSIDFEKFIVQYVESDLPRIVQDCQRQFPNRKDIIDEIQMLYNDGYYRAVVVLCYTQADGISNDLFDVGFFDTDRSQNYKLKTYIEIKKNDSSYSERIISQLNTSSNEITAWSKSDSFKQEDRIKCSFNRHLVLHGHSIDYGTKLNAVRAICILDFLQSIGETTMRKKS